MNKIFLIGNLTKDPEGAETPNGVSVCRFSVAVNRPYTDGNGERQTDFFNITAWRGLAENCVKYLSKGKKVAVTGSMQMRVWEDNDGNKHQAVDVIANEVEFLSPSEQAGEKSAAKRSTNEGREPRRENPRGRLQEFDDDGDIPF